ncbi:MAG: tRNA (adenosine(37)-N6)-threonylcarbamoyltransferase complex ATPase subunit type 1 TsaE [Coriobacteriales bacterium]|jgi:tRNA threonylcarbamoyladenosine biosynthesis protein TsaE|nr:tRNA (adenosine(37)-N6)-threonylcarbamoyltransferase complex ATPase subunit type 1 TsaE [Coriobacteriales bacterium]
MTSGAGYRVMTQSAEETLAFGVELGYVARPGDIIILTGDLGAGKTQLAKGIAQGLGITESITSPTFNLMLVYKAADKTLQHFDLYRLEAAEQLDDIDYFGCLESDAISLVEWGDKFSQALPEDYLEISLELGLSGNARELSLGGNARELDLSGAAVFGETTPPAPITTRYITVRPFGTRATQLRERLESQPNGSSSAS